MRIYPAAHYTMGGLWVDYNLMSHVPGLHVIGEPTSADHGANRLGASALHAGPAPTATSCMPYTIGNYLAQTSGHRPSPDRSRGGQVAKPRPRCAAASMGLLAVNGNAHRGLVPSSELGGMMWDEVRHGAQSQGRAWKSALRRSRSCGREFWRTTRCRAAERPQPDAREGRTRRRLPRVRPRSCVTTRWSARSRAAPTSARSTRPRRARPCATTTTTLPRRGLGAPGRRAGRRPDATKKSSTFENVSCRSGATSKGRRSRAIRALTPT